MAICRAASVKAHTAAVAACHARTCQPSIYDELVLITMHCCCNCVCLACRRRFLWDRTLRLLLSAVLYACLVQPFLYWISNSSDAARATAYVAEVEEFGEFYTDSEGNMDVPPPHTRTLGWLGSACRVKGRKEWMFKLGCIHQISCSHKPPTPTSASSTCHHLCNIPLHCIGWTLPHCRTARNSQPGSVHYIMSPWLLLLQGSGTRLTSLSLASSALMGEQLAPACSALSVLEVIDLKWASSWRQLALSTKCSRLCCTLLFDHLECFAAI